MVTLQVSYVFFGKGTLLKFRQNIQNLMKIQKIGFGNTLFKVLFYSLESNKAKIMNIDANQKTFK